LGQKVNLYSKKDFFNLSAVKKRSRDDKEKEKGKEDELKFKEGVVVKFSGIPEEKKDDKGALKDFFSKFGKVNYVEYRPDQSSDAYCRFDDPESAKKLVESADTEKYFDATLTYSLLAGDDEKAYWDKIAEFHSKKKFKNKRSKGGRRR